VALAGVVSACANDAQNGQDGSPDAGAAAEHAYALVTLVWSDDGPTGYVVLSDSLEQEDLTLDDAREFPGYTSVGVADKQLLVNPSWEDPTIERYEITPELGWKDSDRLSFGNEGVEAVSFHTQYLRDDHAAYLDVDVRDRVIWDPIDLTILDTRSDDVLEAERDGLKLYANFNRTQLVFGGSVVRPFSYHDDDWIRWSPNSPIVIYDSETHEATDVIDAPCPGLDSITRDEDGNTYLGSLEYSALYPLAGLGAAPCAVRLTPDNELDADWDLDLNAIAGGRHVVNFRYIGGGKALATVLHEEEYGEDYDFTQLAETIDDFWAMTARFHRLWMFDIEERSGAPVEGIDEIEFVNPGFYHSTFDGRTFVFLGDGQNGNNFDTTFVYEIEADGSAKRQFSVPGTVTQWVQVW
jgi:hypothetical protein